MPFLKPRTPTKQKPRVDFDIDDLRTFIATNGMEVVWEMVTECPCVEPLNTYGMDEGSKTVDAGKSNPDCPTCDGRGYFFHSKQEVVAQITSAVSDPDRFRDYGEMASGMISLTTYPENRLNLGDRITLTKSVMRTDESHKYRGENPSSTRYPIKVRELDLESGPLDLGVLNIWVADAAGVADLSGEKVEGVDFNITAEGKIEWINPPDADGFWSISYYATPRYLVERLPHPYRDTYIERKQVTPKFTSLPVNAHCKLEFLASGRS